MSTSARVISAIFVIGAASQATELRAENGRPQSIDRSGNQEGKFARDGLGYLRFPIALHPFQADDSGRDLVPALQPQRSQLPAAISADIPDSPFRAGLRSASEKPARLLMASAPLSRTPNVTAWPRKCQGAGQPHSGSLSAIGRVPDAVRGPEGSYFCWFRMVVTFDSKRFCSAGEQKSSPSAHSGPALRCRFFGPQLKVFVYALGSSKVSVTARLL